MTTVRIDGLAELRKWLSNADSILLEAVKPEVGGAALALGMVAQSAVPVDGGSLRASFFVDGAEVNEERKTATATVGYEAPYAAAEHEGIHYQKKNQDRSFWTGRRKKYRSTTPPKWLERAADGFRGSFRSAVKSAVQRAIQKLAVK